jgi:predicted house-cleaning noncanonical NTP pyrophosphatase (MazG superfamily)
MSEKLYFKLVRDDVIDQIEAKGLKVKYRFIEDGQEFIDVVKGKLIEEAKEVDLEDKPEKILEELADVLEVVYAAVEAIGMTRADLRDARSRKIVDKGIFSKRILLESVEED